MSQSIYQFSADEEVIVLQCMTFLVESGHLDGEFSTITGLEVDEVRQVMAAWPNVNYCEENILAQLAVHVSLCEACLGQRVSQLLWNRYCTVSMDEAKDLAHRWLGTELPPPRYSNDRLPEEL